MSRQSEIAIDVFPHSIPAEQELIGSILIDNKLLDHVSNTISAVHFYDPLHGQIYESARVLIEKGQLVTPVTLRQFFEDHEPINDVTVPTYIAKMAIDVSNLRAVREHAKTIKDLAARRALMQIGADVLESAQYAPPGMDPREIIEAAEMKLYAAAETERFGRGSVSFREAMSSALADFKAASQRKSGLAGLPSGIRSVDEAMGGFSNGHLVILAARPAMGKSAYAVNVATHMAMAAMDKKPGGVPTGIFSLEMPDTQIAGRILASEAGISLHSMTNGTVTPDEMARASESWKRIDGMPMEIDSTGGLSIGQLAARARRMKRQKGIGFLVVDYLQLLSGGKAENRVQALTEITTGLKALAKELNIPVLALSQLSRDVEKREDKRPQLSDLRESGSIEQDADVVMFIMREEYYLERERPEPTDKKYDEWLGRMNECRGKAEIIIGKNRHGPVGTVKVSFDGRLTKFRDI